MINHISSCDLSDPYGALRFYNFFRAALKETPAIMTELRGASIDKMTGA